MSSDLFWKDSPQILYKQDRLVEFIPTGDQTISEKLNAIMRFAIYSSIFASLYFNKSQYLLIIILVAVITYFIKSNVPEEFNNNEDIPSENIESETVRPTIDNPFMNPSIFDDPIEFRATKYTDNSQDSNDIKKEIFNKFSHNLYKDVSDIYDTNNGFRQFYTVPDNINNYDEYKDFMCPQFKVSGKENTYECFKNVTDPLKSKRHNY